MSADSAYSDQEGLRYWLEGHSRDDALCIAHRVALRVAPVSWQLHRDPETAWFATTIHMIWLLLVSAVARNTPAYRMWDASIAARELCPDYLMPAASSAVELVRDQDSFENAVEAAMEATLIFGTVDSAFTFDSLRSVDSVGSLELVNYPPSAASVAAIWKSVKLDCELIDRKEDPFLYPLWITPPPLGINDLWIKTREEWESKGGAGWDFWIKWYENALEGRSQDWPLLRHIALIPLEDWKGGPERVHPIIERMLLERAVAVTPNAETVDVNPETGKLRLMPATDLPVDIGDYARRKIRKAIGLFDAGSANQYSALVPDLAMLTVAVDDAGNLPVELFDACASASRRLGTRIRNGDCPSGDLDPLIADYQIRVREAGLDILGHDPKTRDVVAARNAIVGNDALIENAEVLRGSVEVVLPATEGNLTIVLSRDVEIATDPNTDPDERKSASVKLSSRLLRVAKVSAAVVAGGGTLVVSAKEVLEAIPAIQASPLFQQALQAILRYLGY